MATDAEKMLADYYAAWNSHDVENLASFFTDDLICEDVPMGAVQRNKKEFKDSWSNFFDTCPDFRLELKAVFAADNWAGSEWIISGTHAGDWPGLPATGKRFSLRGASICELRDGKLKRESMYWDGVSLLQQLGFMPEMPSA